MLEEQLKIWQSIDLWKIVKNAIKENKEILEDLVRFQLLAGEQKDGRTAQYTGTPASNEYIKTKLSLGRIDRSILPHVNLFNEGDFHERIVAEIKNQIIEITSTDSKATEIEKEFSSKIYELNDARMEEFIQDYILPDVLEEINKKIR